MQRDLIHGIRDAIPIMTGYIPIAMAFGVVSVTTGISPISTVLMSIFVYAGASQFIAVSLISMGSSIPEIIFTTFFVNLRHLLMSTVISNRISGNISIKLFLAHGITDETFAFTAIKKGFIPLFYIVGLYLTCFLSWVLGTMLGAILALNIPKFLTSSLSFILIALFIVLLVLSIDSSVSLIVAIIGFIITPILTLLLMEASLILAILICSGIGVCFERWLMRE